MKKSHLGMIALAAAGLATIGWQMRTIAALRGEVAALHATAEMAAPKRAGTTALRTVANPAFTTGARSERDAEVAQLRGEIARLQDELKKDAPARAASKFKDEDPELKLVATSNWKNAGTATPEASIQTFFWAAFEGEVDLLANGIVVPEADRAKVMDWFSKLPPAVQSQYGEPEKLIALMLAKDAGPLTGLQIVGERKVNDDVLINTRFTTEDASIDQAAYLLRQTPSGWRLVVPADSVAQLVSQHLRPKE